MTPSRVRDTMSTLLPEFATGPRRSADALCAVTVRNQPENLPCA